MVRVTATPKQIEIAKSEEYLSDVKMVASQKREVIKYVTLGKDKETIKALSDYVMGTGDFSKAYLMRTYHLEDLVKEYNKEVRKADKDLQDQLWMIRKVYKKEQQELARVKAIEDVQKFLNGDLQAIRGLIGHNVTGNTVEEALVSIFDSYKSMFAESMKNYR